MKLKYLNLIVIPLIFFNIAFAQNNKGFSYDLKKANRDTQFLQRAKNAILSDKNKSSARRTDVSFIDIVPIYVDNMIWDQNIVQVPGGLPNQVLNATWAYGHFANQNGEWTKLFGNLENLLFLPYGYGDTLMTVQALDSRLSTIYYFDKNNIEGGVQHYGTYGRGEHNFRKASAFVLGRKIDIGESETDFNIYMCDEINNRVVHVVYQAIPGDNQGFKNTPFDIVANLTYPFDIDYFHCIDSTNDKLWVSTERLFNPTINCFDLGGNEIQNISGYQDQNGTDFPFLTGTQIKMSVFNYYFNCLAFIDSRRNYMVTCYLNPDGTANVVGGANGESLIRASYIAVFPDDMRINSLKFQVTSHWTQLWPYLWVTSGYSPPYDDNLSVLHCLKVNAALGMQYLGSTRKPGSTLYYFNDLKNLACADGYYDLFTIEFWQPQYGIRRYMPYADLYSDSLRYYCADSVDNMRWVAELTNECYTRFTAQRIKQDGKWESVKFKNVQVDGAVFYPYNGFYEPVVWNLAGWTQEAAGNVNGYVRMQLDLPIEDYILGGKVKLNMRLYPEWADRNNLNNFDGYVLNKNYEADILRNCNQKPGGCPFLYFKDQNNNSVAENNMLHKSEFSGASDITDRYVLKSTPQEENGKMKLYLAENENDVSYINQAKLYAIDFPTNRKMGLTEENIIVLYDSSTVVASDSVSLNGTEITSNVNYHNSTDTVNGFKTDNLYAHFSYASSPSKSKNNTTANRKNRDNTEKVTANDRSAKHGPGGSQPIYAFISNLGNLKYPIASAKDTGGVLTANSVYSNTVTKIFARRENSSVIILPLFGDTNYVNDITINWQSDFSMRNLGIATLQYNGYTSTELNLNQAHYITSNLDSNITSLLSGIDFDYGMVSSTGLIKMEFNTGNLPAPSPGDQRAFMVEITGYYQSGDAVNSSKKPSEQIPLTYSLSQNYPNPFNPTTKINYSIAKDGMVKLIVYDILGREVIKLVNDEFMKAGRYSTEFDGKSLASGVYFYRIESGSYTQSKKMVLIK